MEENVDVLAGLVGINVDVLFGFVGTVEVAADAEERGAARGADRAKETLIFLSCTRAPFNFVRA